MQVQVKKFILSTLLRLRMIWFSEDLNDQKSF